MCTDAELRRLFVARRGNRFEDRRDTAPLSCVTSTGARVRELVGLRLMDLNCDCNEA